MTKIGSWMQRKRFLLTVPKTTFSPIYRLTAETFPKVFNFVVHVVDTSHLQPVMNQTQSLANSRLASSNGVFADYACSSYGVLAGAVDFFFTAPPPSLLFYSFDNALAEQIFVKLHPRQAALLPTANLLESLLTI